MLLYDAILMVRLRLCAVTCVFLLVVWGNVIGVVVSVVVLRGVW